MEARGHAAEMSRTHKGVPRKERRAVCFQIAKEYLGDINKGKSRNEMFRKSDIANHYLDVY